MKSEWKHAVRELDPYAIHNRAHVPDETSPPSFSQMASLSDKDKANISLNAEDTMEVCVYLFW